MIAAALLLLAQVHLPCSEDITEALRSSDGADVELGAGACMIAAPLHNAKPMRIIGRGKHFTSIRAQRGAFIGDAYLHLGDLKLWRADFATETSTLAIGVLAQADLSMQHVRLEGFTASIVFSAGIDKTDRRNADGWRLEDIESLGTAHAAIIVGHNGNRRVNGGYAIGVRAMTACERGSKWEALFGPCTGIIDKSWLGNEWNATLIASSMERLPGGLVLRYPSFVSINGESTWTGTYCERDQAAAIVDEGVLALGGHCAITGTGMRITGGTISGAEIANAQDPARKTILRLGSRAAPGSFIDYVPPWATSKPLRRQADPKSQCYLDRIANQLETGRVCQDGTTRTAKPVE